MSYESGVPEDILFSLVIFPMGEIIQENNKSARMLGYMAEATYIEMVLW